MKCSNPECKCWFIAKANAKKQYVCPWCDNINDRPHFLQFKDRYYVSKIQKKENEVFSDKPVYSFVLRNEKNDITNNYISNMYIIIIIEGWILVKCILKINIVMLR